MKIYSVHGAVVAGLVQAVHYCNPDYFDKATETDQVLLVGDYPHIEQAYQEIGVPVEKFATMDELQAYFGQDAVNLAELNLAELKAFATSKGIEFDSNIKKADLLALLSEKT